MTSCLSWFHDNFFLCSRGFVARISWLTLNMRDALSSTLLPIDLHVRVMIYIAYNNITSRLVASPGHKVTCNLICWARVLSKTFPVMHTYVYKRGIIGENRERAKVTGGQQSVLSGGTAPGEFSWMLLPGTSVCESRSAMTYEYTIKRSRRSFRRVRSSFTRNYATPYLTFDMQ